MPTVPMFPLEVAMLPGEELPLRIFEPRYSALVQACLAAEDPAFGTVLIEAGREVGGGDSRSDVGTLAHITEYVDLGEGRYAMKCAMVERFRVIEWLPDDPYPRAVIDCGPTSRARRSRSTRSATSKTEWWRCSSGSRRRAVPR